MRADLGLSAVGRTGFEPVTSSVSGTRSPAEPTARASPGIPGAITLRRPVTSALFSYPVPTVSAIFRAISGVCYCRAESNWEPLTCEKNLTGSCCVGGRLNTLAPISGSHGLVPDLRLTSPDGAVLSLVPVMIRP